jgi:hypothetical protein
MGFGRIAALALTALALPAAAEGRSYGIEARGSAQSFGEVLAIGDFKPRRDPTLGAAIDAYGPPASARAVSGNIGSKGSWPGLGVKATFA